MKLSNKAMQKLIGIFMILIGLIPIWLDGDGTASIILIPRGLYVLLTRKDLSNL